MLRPMLSARLGSLLVLALLGGCAMSPFVRRGPAPVPATVEVRNDRWEDLTVYLEREGGSFRLGVVPGKGNTTLEVPEDYLRMNCWVRLVARTAGRETRAASETFGMDPGSRVSWFVPLTNGETPVAVKPPLY